ncbi:MAG: UvrD-helicase domain-containing protein [Phycisphaerae bacterium]
MIDVRKLTDAQRRAGIKRIGDNLALRSGAGCGKTLVLTRRFAELLLNVGRDANPLDRLVAVTFTEKAAMEMTSRVRKFLSARAAQARSQADRMLWRNWVQELPEARISTIHAFCARLLRTCAVEAGLDPGFAVCADELLTARMRNEAAEQALLAAVEREDEDAMSALNLLTFDAAAAGARTLLETRTSWRPEDYSDAESVLARWDKLLRQYREKLLDDMRRDIALAAAARVLEDLSCDDPSDKLAPAHAAAREFTVQVFQEGTRPSREAAESVAGVDLRGGSQKNWGGKEAKKELVEALKVVRQAAGSWIEAAEGLGEADRQSAETLVTLVRLAQEANELYAAEKRGRGLLDFDDLLLTTHTLLSEHDETARRLREGLDQLLLDEAQDTGALEVELLKKVIGDGEGRLFLVGDDKQSIYRFRGAQVEVFRDWCDELGPRRLEDLDLSFRTHPAGVAFINHLFGRLMGQTYAPIQAHRGDSPPQPSVEMVLVSGDEHSPVSNSDDAWRAQADATAERIREMLDSREALVRNADDTGWRPVRQGDIAVLMTRMTNTAPLERALAQRGIDYYVVAGTGFFQRQEVLDLLNALRAIDNPRDDVALVGVLRSEMFAVTDESLLKLRESVSPPYFPALLADGPAEALPDDQADACRRCVEMIRDLHRRKDSVGIGELLEEVLSATGYEAVLLSRFQGRRMVGNIRRTVELARQATVSGLTLAQFVRQMSEQTAEQSRQEQAAVSGEQEDVVRLMTVHKAKGLEFPVVILPDLNHTRQGPKGPLLNRLDWGWTLNVSGDEESGPSEEKPLSFRVARKIEAEDQKSEDIRTLYVAVTRHRDHLVFVGADVRDKNGETIKGDNTLSQLNEVFGLTAAADAGRDRIGYGDGYELALKQVKWSPVRGLGKQSSRGGQLLRAASSPVQFVEAVASAGGKKESEPPLLGPLPADVGDVEVAVTALSDFEHCPLLYRRRYELRMPPPDRRAAEASAGPDALTLGTLYHRAMELVDFDRPQPADALIRRAAADTELDDDAEPATITAEFERMLETLRQTALWESLKKADTKLRELDFILELSPAVLRGQIDLLVGFPDRGWEVIDYKSDRVSDEHLPEHAAGYELQMLCYALAVRACMGEAPSSARLVFLRSGRTYEFDVTDEKLSAAERDISELARRLISARRSGRFEPKQSPACRRCPYARLCGL